MTIPGRGDLSPRRRQHRPGRTLAGLLVLAVLAGAGYVGYRHFNDGSSTPRAAAPPLPRCPPAAGNALFAAPGQVRVRIVNGSLQTGLAARVRSALRRRGIHVVSIGNALKVGHDIAAIRFSADQQRAARTVSAQIVGAPLMQPVSGNAVLELELGLRFTSLVPARAARATENRALAASSPSPSPTPTASPTCRAS